MILGSDVSRETRDRLQIYADLVRKWNPTVNLVSRSSLDELENRHFYDSAQLLTFAPERIESWVDLGSGGGFPGAVAAICLAERSPGTSVTLVESDQRKSAFLRTVARETGVKFTVLSNRIEEIAPLNADVLSARALAPLSDLLAWTALHRKSNGVALFPKGRAAAKEIEDALEHWRFDCETCPSRTDEEAVILKIGAVERV